MSTSPANADALHHHSRRMVGRDRHQGHRVATPLELLFDLTFVISFGLAARSCAGRRALLGGPARLRPRELRHLLGLDEFHVVRFGHRAHATRARSPTWSSDLER